MELINVGDRVLWTGKSSKYFTHLKIYDVVLVERDQITLIDDDYDEHSLSRKSYKMYKKVYEA